MIFFLAFFLSFFLSSLFCLPSLSSLFSSFRLSIPSAFPSFLPSIRPVIYSFLYLFPPLIPSFSPSLSISGNLSLLLSNYHFLPVILASCPFFFDHPSFLPPPFRFLFPMVCSLWSSGKDRGGVRWLNCAAQWMGVLRSVHTRETLC